MPESDSAKTQAIPSKIKIPNDFDKYCPEWEMLEKYYLGKKVEVFYLKKIATAGILDHFNSRQISIKSEGQGKYRKDSSLYSINTRNGLEIKLKE